MYRFSFGNIPLFHFLLFLQAEFHVLWHVSNILGFNSLSIPILVFIVMDIHNPSQIWEPNEVYHFIS